MGVLLYGVWRPWKERNRKLYLLIVLWVFVSAGADEFHQLFVPGRYGCFADVVLDTCGGAFGLLVCVYVEKIVRRRKQKRKDKGKRDHFVGDLFLCSAMSQVQGFYFLLCRL